MIGFQRTFDVGYDTLVEVSEGESIQEAVDAISDSGVDNVYKILVAAGTFEEQVDLEGKTDIHICGAGRKSTIITSDNVDLLGRFVEGVIQLGTRCSCWNLTALAQDLEGGLSKPEMLGILALGCGDTAVYNCDAVGREDGIGGTNNGIYTETTITLYNSSFIGSLIGADLYAYDTANLIINASYCSFISTGVDLANPSLSSINFSGILIGYTGMDTTLNLTRCDCRARDCGSVSDKVVAAINTRSPREGNNSIINAVNCKFKGVKGSGDSKTGYGVKIRDDAKGYFSDCEMSGSSYDLLNEGAGVLQVTDCTYSTSSGEIT